MLIIKSGFILWAFVISILILYSISSTLKFIDERSIGVVERLNKFNRTLPPGANIILPIIEKVTTVVKLSDVAYILDLQSVITSDNVVIEIDAVAFIRIIDAYKVTYNVDNYKQAIKQKIMCTLRTICGAMTLNALLSNREAICKSVLEQCSKSAEYWGLSLIEIHLKDVIPDKESKANMLKLLEAARQKNATVMHSEGKMLASKNIAESDIVLLSATLEVLKDPALVVLYEYTKCIREISNKEHINTIIVPMDFKSLGNIDNLINKDDTTKNKNKQKEKE